MRASKDDPHRGRVDFTRDLEAHFKAQCLMCHNETLAQAGLRLDSRAAALQGGLSGPALVPGNGRDSALVKRLLGTDGGIRMPQNMEPWSSERIALVRRWIDEGAAWPEAVATPQCRRRPRRPPRRSDPRPRRLWPRPPARAPTSSATWPRSSASLRPLPRPGVQKSHLRLDSRSLALRGGLSGKVIAPGQSAAEPARPASPGRLAPAMPFEGRPCPRPRSPSSAPGSMRGRRGRRTRLPTRRPTATGPT